MTQTFQLPGALGNESASQAVSTLLPAACESLRSNFSGATAPALPNSATPVPCQFWADTADGYLKVRNVGDTAWNRVAPLNAGLSLPTLPGSWVDLTLNATRTAHVGTAPRAGRIRRIVMISSSASTSSSGNEWRFQLRKYPASAPGSPVDCISANVGTFTVLASVGGGVEFVANAAYVITPNQNLTLADLDKLELVVTKLGTATTLNNFHAHVEIE
jgi:hypothetical protein